MKEVFITRLKDKTWAVIDKKSKELIKSSLLRIECAEYCQENNLRIVES